MGLCSTRNFVYSILCTIHLLCYPAAQFGVSLLVKLIGGTELENCLDYDIDILEAFRLTLVKKNRQNGERRKRSGYLSEKAEP